MKLVKLSIAALCLAWASGCSTPEAAAPAAAPAPAPAPAAAPRGETVVATVEVTATVIAIYQETREVTLRMEDGTEVSFVASEDVKNLPQVKVGDVPLPAPKKYHSMEIPADLEVDQELPIVLNDAGGGIFSLLEYGELAERGAAETAQFERLFGTPHAADVSALCRGFGVPHCGVGSVAELSSVLAQPVPGTSVVEVRADRSDLRRLHADLRTAVHAAVRQAIT